MEIAEDKAAAETTLVMNFDIQIHFEWIGSGLDTTLEVLALTIVRDSKEPAEIDAVDLR